MSQTDLDAGLFDATVSSLTHSFGDRTRRAVYLFVRENPGATASALAEHCGVHPNVVRHHLERLVEGGYVVAEPVHRSTVGRPAKGYRALETAGTMEALVRRDALLVALLERALGRLGPDLAEAIAHEVGVEYGRGLSGEVSVTALRCGPTPSSMPASSPRSTAQSIGWFCAATPKGQVSATTTISSPSCSARAA